MSNTSIPLLLFAAASVGFLHSILPDHWVPLAVIARTQRWSVLHTARVSFLASVGHVLTSIVLAGIIAAIGLRFRSTFEREQSHIVGVILVVTGLAFLVWALTEHGGHHHNHEHHVHGHAHELAGNGSLARRFAAIAIPFGAAASPDLTILPVALAASAIGVGVVIGTLVSFTVVTLATFVVLTVAATVAGYQVRGEWLEERGMLITALILIVIGSAVYLGL